MPKVRYVGGVDSDETPLEEVRRVAAERKLNRAFEIASDIEEMSSELGRVTQFGRVEGPNWFSMSTPGVTTELLEEVKKLVPSYIMVEYNLLGDMLEVTAYAPLLRISTVDDDDDFLDDAEKSLHDEYYDDVGY
jgi:hypothetical protein